MNLRPLILVPLLLCTAFTVSTKAEVNNYTFQIINTIENGLGPVTLEGEILGLPSDTAFAIPEDIIFTSFPPEFGLSSAPYSLSSNGWDLADGGYFVVNAEGVITSDTSYEAFKDESYSLRINFYDSDFGYRENTLTSFDFGPDHDIFQMGNFTGLEGITFTLETVPEPGTYAFLALSTLALLYGGRRFSNRQSTLS